MFDFPDLKDLARFKLWNKDANPDIKLPLSIEGILYKKGKKKKMTVKESHEILIAEESDKMIEQDAIIKTAKISTENNGIVFLDEIDKVSARGDRIGGDVSREGVQRDLLPLIEGTTVSTKHGPIKTDHILFIASGAFQLAKPSDLLPELQGRLDGTAVRVPTPNVSMIDLVFNSKKKIDAETINNAMIKASKGELKGVLGVEDKPLVSIDYNHNPLSSIFDLTQTQVIKGRLGRVLSWYDNEWGFANRMGDTASLIGKLIKS